MSQKNKVTKLQRFLETDPLLTLLNQQYSENYSNENYVLNFFCAKTLGFAKSKQCPENKNCKECWNKEWEGEVLREEIPVQQSNSK